MAKLTLAALAAALLISSSVFAAPVSDEEAKAVNAEVLRRITTEPEKLESEALSKAFAATFYAVKIRISDSKQTTMTIEMQLARLEDKFVEVVKPTTTQAMPNLSKIVHPDFRMTSEEQAGIFEQALDMIHPMHDSGRKKQPKEIRHEGSTWTFIRGSFFGDLSGFIVTTDEAGAVTKIDYSLRIKK